MGIDQTPPPVRKADKLGLPSRTTNLPFVVWLLRAQPGLTELSLQVTPSTVYAAPACYAVQPWFHHVGGPYRWLEMAALHAFVRDNLTLIEQFWVGDPAETQAAENRRIAASIKPLPAERLWWFCDMAARMAPGGA